MKKVKISLWGGFHNVGEIRVMISEKDYECIKEGSANFEDVLSLNQYKRVQRHFCGMSDCLCGWIYRNLHWEKIC